jgi:hypothetical protein
VPFIYQSYVQAYLCGDPDCFQKVDVLDIKVYEMCTKISFGAVENICQLLSDEYWSCAHVYWVHDQVLLWCGV